jgi:hypothetical protein
LKRIFWDQKRQNKSPKGGSNKKLSKKVQTRLKRRKLKSQKQKQKKKVSQKKAWSEHTGILGVEDSK